MRYFVEKYGYKKDEYAYSSAWGQKTLSLPIFPDLKLAEQDYVIESLTKVMHSV
jgi:dTDP-4-amino-4,6-dideoxygalactose transaminase